MIGKSPLLRLALALLVVANVFGLTALWDDLTAVDPPVTASEPVTTIPTDGKTPAPDALPDRPWAAYGQITSRPLFARNRAPWNPPRTEITEATAAAQPHVDGTETGPSFDARLLGVVSTPDIRKILITTAKTGDPVWLAEGETIDGWVVKSVRRRSATLEQGTSVTTLRLFADDP